MLKADDADATTAATARENVEDDDDATASTREKVKVGAIRWDAYFTKAGIDGAVGAFCAEAMSAPEFQWHLPFYAEPPAAEAVEAGAAAVFNVNITQAAIDQEIKYAVDNGIDYFAFDMYPQSKHSTITLGSIKRQNIGQYIIC